MEKSSLERSLEARLSRHRQAGLIRVREAKANTRGKICFSNNDYLGLVSEPLLLKAFEEGARQYGFGTGSSALVSGYSPVHERCEAAFSEYLNRERSLLFANGYLGNIGILPALFDEKSTLFFDKYNHASLYDGARLSGAELVRYRHLDLNHLHRLLSRSERELMGIVTESVFSTDGSESHIPRMITLCSQSDATLIIDHAHGFGVSDFPYSQEEVPVLICPLGKALGGFGSIISGSDTVIEAIMQFARSYMFSTAAPPAIAYALTEGLHLMKTQTWRKEKLMENIQFFKIKAKELGLNFSPSNHPIQSLIVGDPQTALSFKKRLFEAGFDVTIMRPPTVPPLNSLVRISLGASHSFDDISGLLEAMV
jgi:8-amino-7-oxononanoate synthase